MSNNYHSRLSNTINLCRTCLVASDNLRPMNYEEIITYKHIIKEMENNTNELHICMYCGFLIKKINKFRKQCLEAGRLFQEYLEQDIKTNLIFEKSNPNYVITLPEHHYLGPEPNADDDFDYDDVPLSSFIISDVVKVKKKKRKKIKTEQTKLDTDQEIQIKLEADLTETSLDSTLNACDKQTLQSKSKRQKTVREGFSSRMVQETDEYIVIKLTKEQVLKEMEEKSKSIEYQRALYKCEKCVKGFNFEDVLTSHMEKHTMENGSLLCEICFQYCPSVVSLRGHMKSHTTRYSCKVCGLRRGSRQHLLEHHALAHTALAAQYNCERCPFTTHKRTVMQRHARSHRTRERHACHRCGKLFLNVETLRVHTMRHDKSKRLQCEHCNRVFIYPSMLHKHIQAVHIRKDYYCVECDIKFKSRDNLRLHFKKAKSHREPLPAAYQRKNTSISTSHKKTENIPDIIN